MTCEHSADDTERTRGRLNTLDTRVLAYVLSLAIVAWFWSGPELSGFIIGTGALLVWFLEPDTEGSR